MADFHCGETVDVDILSGIKNEILLEVSRDRDELKDECDDWQGICSQAGK